MRVAPNLQLRLHVAPPEAANQPAQWALEGVEVQRSSDGAVWYFSGGSEPGVPAVLRSDDAAATALYLSQPVSRHDPTSLPRGLARCRTNIQTDPYSNVCIFFIILYFIDFFIFTFAFPLIPLD